MHTLIIRHTADNGFRVMRLEDGKAAPETALTPPDAVTVPGRPDSHLLADLTWYLEQFLDYPFPPNTELAERIQDSLRDWGEQCFARLFAGQALLWYDQARRAGLEHLTLKIASDDPRVLGWPWEALRDPHGSTLAHGCRIERQLSELHDPLPLPEQLPRERIHILLIIARPYGATDVGYHALARPLVEQVAKRGLPVHIEVLRPPSFANLTEHLRRHPGRYHIVHFDGHGGYGPAGHLAPAADPNCYRGAEGRLIFEDAKGEADPIPAGKLTALLGEHRIPIMVLNACQSARIDARADDPFASVAAALLKAGMRAVVAMGYNLYVSAAQQFVPAFYDRLLASGAVAEAVRAGRQAMLLADQRVCARGDHPLADWLVPVLYQQDALDLPVEGLGRRPTADKGVRGQLPEAAQRLAPEGFIGRQWAIQTLERAFQTQPQAVILIYGMAGIGKSTLVRGLLDWLAGTGGLGAPEDGARFADVLWTGFDNERSTEGVVNPIVERLFGHAATAAPMADKIARLTEGLRRTPLLLVWDNFESAVGIPGTEVEPLLPEADRDLLAELLGDLRGGQSRVLITSRSSESCPRRSTAYRLPLSGLVGEERWAYCNAVLAELGVRPNRDDAQLQALMDALEGHPLAMHAVLPRLADTAADRLLAELQAAFADASGCESTRAIQAALALLDAGLSAVFGPVLELIGLHRRYLDIRFFEAIAERSGTSVPRKTLEQCLATLEEGGLVQRERQGLYRMHLALHGWLAKAHPAPEPAKRGFVDVMGYIANQLTPMELHQQRGLFAFHGASFYEALVVAAALEMDDDVAALTQSLAAFAQNQRNFSGACRLYKVLAEHHAERDQPESLAAACHQVGIIAQEQRDFASAESWYQRSLEIKERRGAEHGAAPTYHQLGMIALERRDFASAEAWCQKSLAIKEQQGDVHGAAKTYHVLGTIGLTQRDFASAEAWYRKALATDEKQGSAQSVALTYHQLGKVANAQRNFASAESWWRKALAIFEQQGDVHRAAITYHQLGLIAEESRDLSSAEGWHCKALAVFEQDGDAQHAAGTYHQLGRIAEQRRDFATAKEWYRKSLDIDEKQGNAQDASRTYHQLGIIAQKQRDFASAEAWYRKALAIEEQQSNLHYAAITHHNLGIIAEAQHDLASAGRWLLKSVKGLVQTSDPHNLRIAVESFLRIIQSADSTTQSQLRQAWQDAGLDQLPNLAGLERQFSEQSKA